MNVKMLSPKEIAEQTGLPYGKALKLIKQLNHIQIDNLYYVAEDILYDFLHPDTPIKVTFDEQEDRTNA